MRHQDGEPCRCQSREGGGSGRGAAGGEQRGRGVREPHSGGCLLLAVPRVRVLAAAPRVLLPRLPRERRDCTLPCQGSGGPAVGVLAHGLYLRATRDRVRTEGLRGWEGGARGEAGIRGQREAQAPVQSGHPPASPEPGSRSGARLRRPGPRRLTPRCCSPSPPPAVPPGLPCSREPGGPLSSGTPWRGLPKWL